MLPPRAMLSTVALGVIYFSSVGAAPNVSVHERHSVILRIRCLTARATDVPAEGAYVLELEPGKGGSVEFEARWPDDATASRVTVVAIARPAASQAAHLLRLEGVVERPDGQRDSSSRDLEFTESTTALFELAREDERSLTLAVEAEDVRETVFAARPQVGVPVVMHLEVEWIEDGQSSSLETNRLSTFVGEPVSYSFRLGETGEAEALEVRLTPVGIFGDVIQVQAEVTGSVPRAGGLELVSKSERWMISRGRSAALDVAAGEPPIGFRFSVTPRF